MHFSLDVTQTWNNKVLTNKLALGNGIRRRLLVKYFYCHHYFKYIKDFSYKIVYTSRSNIFRGIKICYANVLIKEKKEIYGVKIIFPRRNTLLAYKLL